jgi:cold shock CspA family protein
MSEDSFVSGIVKWFSKAKGFGFIQLPGGGLDIFVHANQLKKSFPMELQNVHYY